MNTKTFTITKKQIINAITTEPIGSNGGVYATSKPFGKTTKLSAVGAVLRSLVASHKTAKGIVDMTRDAFNEVAGFNKNNVDALSALEGEYSYLRSTMRAPKLRSTLAGWVKDVFPAKIEVTIWNPATTTTTQVQA